MFKRWCYPRFHKLTKTRQWRCSFRRCVSAPDRRLQAHLWVPFGLPTLFFWYVKSGSASSWRTYRVRKGLEWIALEVPTSCRGPSSEGGRTPISARRYAFSVAFLTNGCHVCVSETGILPNGTHVRPQGSGPPASQSVRQTAKCIKCVTAVILNN